MWRVIGFVVKGGTGEAIDLNEVFLEVGNGCICCAVKDDLVTTLEGLMKMHGSKFDHVIIGT